MTNNHWRTAIAEYIREQAQPPDKFHHQPRLYQLTLQVGAGETYDDEVVYAAVWLHDLGVFVGHRPEDPAALAAWDHIAYATGKIPGLLRSLGFPSEKIPAVVEVVRTHMPSSQPGSIEGEIVRDADILEQLGAVGIMRQLSKVGRDTRFRTHAEAVRSLRRSLATLPRQIHLPSTRRLAEPRIAALAAFLEAYAAEAGAWES